MILEVSIALPLLLSCKRDPAPLDNQNLVPYLTVSQENFNILADAGSKTLNISSNFYWKVTSDQNWLTLNKSIGNKNDSITVNYSSNNSSTENRTAVLSFYILGKVKKTISINQSVLNPTLNVSPTNQNVDIDSSSINIQVTSNISWTATSDQSWCIVSPMQGSASGNVAVIYSKNTGESRTATITFSGIGVGSQTVTVSQREGLVTDINGNTYNVIKIGSQYWLDRNLNVTLYRNGDAIPNISDGNAWKYLTTGAYCNNNNDASNAAIYGRLYNGYAASDNRNIAPEGWHVPTDTEWTVLTTYLGGVSVAGGKLKETGTTHWLSPNIGATNESGFTALPGGYRDLYGDYYVNENYGYWWSSTMSSTDAWVRILLSNNINVVRNNSKIIYGFSVRCVRD